MFKKRERTPVEAIRILCKRYSYAQGFHRDRIKGHDGAMHMRLALAYQKAARAEYQKLAGLAP